MNLYLFAAKVLKPMVTYVAVLKIKRLLKNLSDDPKEILDFAYRFSHKFCVAGKCIEITIRPVQVREELLRFAELIDNIKPTTVMEIGTAMGGTLFILVRVSSPKSLIISVDLPGGMFGGGYSWYRKALYKTFAKPGQRIYLLRKDSHDLRTLNEVTRILQGKKLDLLFIDGDHTYEGVRKDFEMYSPLVRRGGIIAFHDIVPHDRVHDPHGVVGVPRFWNEIKHSYKYLEIVKDWGQGWAGIGVLYV